MKPRTLGNGGLTVSAIGYGCMGLASVYGPATDRQEAIAISRCGRRPPGQCVPLDEPVRTSQ